MRGRLDDLRERALRDLQQSHVLMVNGHFDYGNGYHGYVPNNYASYCGQLPKAC